MCMADLDSAHMQRALELAKCAWGQTHPNPMVGALIVEAGAVVAEGWHTAAGEAHAEIEAFRALGRKPLEGAILYVTLEPCSTSGRTGACTDAILASGVRKVVVGAVDPNPNHAGKGLEILRAAGIEVVEGVCAEACRDLNLIFNHWIVKNRPLLAMKIALTLDGKFAAGSGHSRWVTGESARSDVMRWRRYFPAIAVGADTALADDPQLTSRINDNEWCPQRFVLDRQLRTAGADLRLFTDTYADLTTVVCGESADVELEATLNEKGVSVWRISEQKEHLDWTEFSMRLADESVYGLYIEAGPRLSSALVESELADYAFVYRAPKFMSDSAAVGMGSQRETHSMEQAFELKAVVHAHFGADSLTRGWL